MSFEQRYIGEILVRRGALEPEKLDSALETAADRSVDLRDFLVATLAVEEDKVVRALADEVGMEFVEKIATELIPEELVDAVPINFARQNHVLPLTQSEENVRVAIANPLDPFPIDDLRILLGKAIIPVAASEETIDDAINRVYERKDETALAEAKEGEEVEELRVYYDVMYYILTGTTSLVGAAIVAMTLLIAETVKGLIEVASPEVDDAAARISRET